METVTLEQRKQALINLKERIQNTEILAECYYHKIIDGKQCYCSVGHIFVQGGMQPEVEIKEPSINGRGISMAIEQENIRIALVKAGFDPEKDYYFLKGLQRLNDKREYEGEPTRKERVLKHIEDYTENIL